MHVDKISDSLVDNHSEIIAIRKRPNAAKIGSLQKRVARKFAEKCKVFFTSFTPPFQVIEVCR